MADDTNNDSDRDNVSLFSETLALQHDVGRRSEYHYFPLPAGLDRSMDFDIEEEVELPTLLNYSPRSLRVITQPLTTHHFDTIPQFLSDISSHAAVHACHLAELPFSRGRSNSTEGEQFDRPELLQAIRARLGLSVAPTTEGADDASICALERLVTIDRRGVGYTPIDPIESCSEDDAPVSTVSASRAEGKGNVRYLSDEIKPLCPVDGHSINSADTKPWIYSLNNEQTITLNARETTIVNAIIIPSSGLPPDLVPADPVFVHINTPVGEASLYLDAASNSPQSGTASRMQLTTSSASPRQRQEPDATEAIAGPCLFGDDSSDDE